MSKSIIKDNIVHHPVFVEQTVLDHFDGEPLEYVCTSDFVDYYYRKEPHPKFGNHYLGISVDDYDIRDRIILSRGDHIENMTFGMIRDDNGTLHYSSHVHDYVELSNSKFIDGGRDYIRTNTDVILMQVKDGRFVDASR